MTYLEWLTKMKVKAAADNKDLAIALLKTEDDIVVEADVILLEPGAHPTRFPGPQTQAQKDAGHSWSDSWIIHRCTVQPDRPTINLTPGKFLLGGMPNIVIE